MINGVLDIIISLIASAIFLLFGFFYGRYRERKQQKGKPLEDYDFYPFGFDENDRLQFDFSLFNKAVKGLLQKTDYQAGKQLILIGEQNEVRHLLKTNEFGNYEKLFKKYNGSKILDDSLKYLENYKRIVRLIGDSFPDIGIEILLHNLTNPSKALYHVKNNVTGRNVDAPATKLVLDLKRRLSNNQDKLNYELTIGSRKFKCTTIPIYREEYGIIGAICINVDYHYLNDIVRNDLDAMNKFIDAICKTDMELEENILSKSEYDKAMKGKRHFRDF